MNNRVRMEEGKEGGPILVRPAILMGALPPSPPLSLSPPIRGGIAQWAGEHVRGAPGGFLALNRIRRDAMADRGWELRAALVSQGKQCRVI